MPKLVQTIAPSIPFPGRRFISPPEVAISTINAARHQRLTEEFGPFLAIYYYLSQFIDGPSGDSSIAATVEQRQRLKSPRTEEFFQAVVIVDLALSVQVTLYSVFHFQYAQGNAFFFSTPQLIQSTTLIQV